MLGTMKQKGSVSGRRWGYQAVLSVFCFKKNPTFSSCRVNLQNTVLQANLQSLVDA